MRLLISIFVTLFGSVAGAQEVVLRAGEHTDFTRLVLQSPSIEDWQVDLFDNGFSIRLDGFDGDISLDQVFQRIDRKRIASVRVEGDRIFVMLACDCDVDTELSTQEMIVVDVKGEKNSDELSATPNTLPSQGEPRSLSSLAKNESYPSASPPEFQTDTGVKQEVQLPLFFMDALETETFQFPTNGLRVMRKKPQTTNQISNHQIDGILHELTSDVARLMTKGILTARSIDTIQLNNNDSTSSSAGQKNDKPSVGMPTLNSGGAPLVGRIQDQAMTTPFADGSCELVKFFSVHDWNKSDSFSQLISGYRASLYGEFDILNNDVQIALARAYASYGFGAETLQISNIHGSVDDDSLSALRIIGGILEYGSSFRDSSLSSFVDCDNDMALWAILSSATEDLSTPVNAESAIRAIEKLPFHLRKIIAPMLSAKLRTLGDSSSAARTLRSIDRTGEPLEASARFEESEVFLAQSRDERAVEGFHDVSSTNSFEAPMALVRYIDLQISGSGSLSRETALLAEAYASEHRNTDIGPEIKRAHILALAKSGQLSEAFNSLRFAENIDIGVDEIYSAVFDVIHSDSESGLFLEYVLSMSTTDLKKLSNWTNFKIGQRLQSLGFSRIARRHIENLPQAFNPRDLAMLQARIARDLGEFQLVLSKISGFEGNDFLALEATALYGLERFEEAAEIFEELNLSDRTEIAKWRANIDVGKGSGFSAINSIQTWEPPPINSAVLESVNALLDDSSRFTATIERALGVSDLEVYRP